MREKSPPARIEILTPDFRGRLDKALDMLDGAPPDVMNHNLETVPRLYKAARPGADYAHSLKLLQDFKTRHSGIPTKSGLMLGLGEEDDEILQVMRDLRAHGVDMLTLGQYLQPSQHICQCCVFVTPAERFAHFEQEALAMGFRHAACGRDGAIELSRRPAGGRYRKVRALGRPERTRARGGAPPRHGQSAQ